MTLPPKTDRWIKSSWSADNADCVEVALKATHDVGVRDSKDPRGGQLTVPGEAWNAFLGGIRS
ncbi:DUF397 domain-containing protein [Amycolatopsis sp. NPDC059021]|uniref:DUF397 domain-containing protein n=1 Tax=Amycolatopsis sp. NPDC059021 TaxID=3346704 RepID=UPI00367360C2